MEDGEDHEESLPISVDGRVGPGGPSHAQRGEELRQMVRVAEASEALGSPALGRCAGSSESGADHEDRRHHGWQDHEVEDDRNWKEGGGDEFLHLRAGVFSPVGVASDRMDSEWMDVRSERYGGEGLSGPPGRSAAVRVPKGHDKILRCNSHDQGSSVSAPSGCESHGEGHGPGGYRPYSGVP